MPTVTRNHPCETLHRNTPDDLPTQQATIEWIIGMHYAATGNRPMGIRHLLKAVQWLERAGAPVQASEVRREIARLCSEVEREIEPRVCVNG